MKDFENASKFVSIIKDIVVVIISILIYCYITEPESILSRKGTKESISRERAKLIMEVLKEPDINKIKISYNIIKCSYYVESDVSSWFWDVDSLINLWISLREEVNNIEQNQRILDTKISSIKTLREYNDLIGQQTNVKEMVTGGDDKTIKNLKIYIKSKDNDLLRYNRTSDSLQTVINQKLKRQL